MPTGMNLVAMMPKFMDGQTASVQPDRTNGWRGHPSLMFRGVARVRPFAMVYPTPIPLPDWVPDAIKEIAMPSIIRDWMMPDVHTDSVGLTSLKSSAFTVQTLQRHFETRDDRIIRNAVKGMFVLAALPVPALAALIALDGDRLSKPLADMAVEVNQHHFLAGRRSFRMGTAAEFGEKGDHWVFETAAVERYSHTAFRLTTDIVMGGAHSSVVPVWRQMGAKVAETYGKMIGNVEDDWSELLSANAVSNSSYYQEIARRHADLLPCSG
jgi:hypothetical protein